MADGFAGMGRIAAEALTGDPVIATRAAGMFALRGVMEEVAEGRVPSIEVRREAYNQVGRTLPVLLDLLEAKQTDELRDALNNALKMQTTLAVLLRPPMPGDGARDYPAGSEDLYVLPTVQSAGDESRNQPIGDLSVPNIRNQEVFYPLRIGRYEGRSADEPDLVEGSALIVDIMSVVKKGSFQKEALGYGVRDEDALPGQDTRIGRIALNALPMIKLIAQYVARETAGRQVKAPHEVASQLPGADLRNDLKLPVVRKWLLRNSLRQLWDPNNGKGNPDLIRQKLTKLMLRSS